MKNLILQELQQHLDNANAWALPQDIHQDNNGFSLLGSIQAAINEGRVGLALDRWDDLQAHKPQLSQRTLQAIESLPQLPEQCG